MQERWDEVQQSLVRRDLHGDNHQVTRADFRCAAVGIHMEVGISLRAGDLEAVLDHGLIIAAQQEMHVMPMLREPAAIVAADCTGTDDGNTA